MFGAITHFDAINEPGPLEWENLEGLAHIPNLTHIYLQHLTNTSSHSSILRHCKKLEALLVMQEVYIEMNAPISQQVLPLDPQIDDIRLVKQGMRTVLDWEMGAAGQEDSWKLAEKIIANRRRKLASSSSGDDGWGKSIFDEE
ncbi:hypothetical protein BDN72DRAFT_250916 [Pluteus cervinus]|uniref:Uncharacterized protein n=1 Tax=Pluteus cervinus TaxID=181527 RepID=A0ACD3AGP9_9AGAR|nr:hypothetical protein BDN72DRAFT_250916 [Pluteus cervinus]